MLDVEVLRATFALQNVEYLVEQFESHFDEGAAGRGGARRYMENVVGHSLDETLTSDEMQRLRDDLRDLRRRKSRAGAANSPASSTDRLDGKPRKRADGTLVPSRFAPAPQQDPLFRRFPSSTPYGGATR